MSSTVVVHDHMILAVHGRTNLDAASAGRLILLKVPENIAPVDGKPAPLEKSAEVWRCDGVCSFGSAPILAGDRVYVTNANSDTVSVISTATDAVVKTLHVGGAGRGRESLLGGSPNAVSVSPDGRTLYVANGSQNAIAVVDVWGRSDDAVKGLIPTGWYPTAVAVDPAGERLFIASGTARPIAPRLPEGRLRSHSGLDGCRTGNRPIKTVATKRRAAAG
jgi:YVTN family beta-propeller protein